MQFNHIANAAAPAASGRTLPVIDPSDGQPFDEIPRSTATDMDAAVHAARQCLDAVWRKISAIERGRLLMRLSSTLAEHAEELATLLRRDGGQPIRQAYADVRALVRCLEFYAGACDKLHGETLPYQDGYSVLTWREPHGVTGHIIPWHDPLPIFGRSVGAALAAGNVCVVKPAVDASLALLRVAQLASDVGFPAGALNIVTGYGHEAGHALARHPGIDHLSFTGSPDTSTLVQQAAAARPGPLMLDLGGKSPQIVFADADLDAAVPAIVHGIVRNAGQTCSAGSRVLIEQAIYEPLLERLSNAFERLRVGPAALDLDIGPLISARQQQRVWDCLSDAQVAGIPLAAQGQVVDEAPETGFYQAPTLLRDVPPQHRLAQEEVFGPVLAAMAFRGEDHALQLANDTRFGLTAGIWTRDGARQLRLARHLRCGQVRVNHYDAGVELPFGGVKSSGHGREGGYEALHGYTTLKTVALRHG